VLRLSRRHAGLLVLLLAASAARVVVTAAYSTALWFPDSATYVDRAASVLTPVDRPWGYSGYLWVLEKFLSFRYIAVSQHVLGIIAIVLVYALLHRRGVSRWVSLLAVAPLAFDAYLLDIEHFVLAETLFLFLLTVAVVVLLLPGRPGPVRMGLVGLLMGALTLTRTVGTFLIGVVLVYLLVRLLLRTVRWVSLLAFALGLAVTLVPYAAWFDGQHGSFALTDYTGHFLYGRVADFVRCDEIDVPVRLRPLCPAGPPSERFTGDHYVWWSDSPANATRDGVRVFSEADLTQFSLAAITGQPWDYLHRVASETKHYLMPGRFSGPQDTCPTWWVFPVPSPVELYNCAPLLAPGPFGYQPTLVRDLRAYQRVVYTPGPALAFCIVAGLAALLRRREDWRDRLDPALLAALGVALLVAPAMTASFDYRYLLPTLAVLPPAAALGLRGLSVRPAARQAADGQPTGDTTPAESEREEARHPGP
jgi:Dolichyl-phosphate-mannose-protein mannosyltransferase